ncbi:MAG: PAS domain-containing protein [Myxococcota bacterium]
MLLSESPSLHEPSAFEQILEDHPDAWSIIELDGDRIVVVWCNRAQASRFGMSPSELECSDLRTLVPPAHYAGWLGFLREVVRSGKPRSFDFEGPPLVGGLARATFVPMKPGPNGFARCAAQVRDETARQRAMQALERSEARLAHAQEIGQIGDWELDLASGTGTWSRQMFRIMGWEGEEPPTFEQFEALVHLEDRKIVARFNAEVVQAEKPLSIVFRLVTPAGETRRIAATAVCLRDAEGKPVRLAGVSRDVSAIEDQLESVRRHETELEVLFEENVNGVYYSLLDEPIEWNAGTDKDALAAWALEHARPVRVNRALCAIVRAPAQELIGRPLRALFPDPLEGRRQLRALYDAGRLHMSRVARLRVDGTRLLADVDLVVTRDAQGRITGQFGMMRDVTAQEEAAEALRQSEARLALALESAELYAWGLDVPTGRTDADPRWAARFGYSVEEMATSEKARSLIHSGDGATARQAFLDHFAGKTPSVSATYRHATRAGGWRWIEVHGKVTERDSSGAPLRMTGISRDITEQRALEQRLLVAERMASLGTLAAGVGHEINNPLTYLSANLALMDDELAARAGGGGSALDVEELRRMLADARDGVNRIVRIVRDLRSLSRSEGVSRRPLDLHVVIERSLELADHEIRHRARVRRDFAPLPPVVADEGRLIQLFLNLFVNAAQAITEGAAEANFITITTRSAEPDYVVVEVSDSGKGMDGEIQERIFDPFFTTKKVGEGTGLGLPICHSIVSDLGGSIEVESTVGDGSTFRVRLPLGSTSDKHASVPAPVPTQKANSLRVLVIDDEATVGRLLARILHGHEVVVETRAADALARLRDRQHFDRILCDVMMPEMSGMDFYEELVRLDASLGKLVIFMTGGAFSARAAAFLASVPNVTVEKPFDPVALRALITKPLD